MSSDAINNATAIYGLLGLIALVLWFVSAYCQFVHPKITRERPTSDSNGSWIETIGRYSFIGFCIFFILFICALFEVIALKVG